MYIEDLKSVKSVDDLKKMGSISEIVMFLSRIIAPLKMDASTYEELYDIISCLKEKWVDLKEGPFVSEKAEFVFYLTMLEGKQRNNLLGITDELYESEELAKQWYHKIAKLVHPDIGGKETHNAFTVLQKLFAVMIDDDEDE